MEINQDFYRGFQFDNFARNERLKDTGFSFPGPLKTGTTIAGVIYKDGVVLGADTRATSGDVIADKQCKKIHYLQPNMYCGGAGTAADLDITTMRMSSHLELHRLHTGRQVPVTAACRMLKQMLFRYQGNIGAYLILGGVDKYGFHLNTIHAHGSTMKTPYTAMGSGSLASMSVLEGRWKRDMELDEAKLLVRDAIAAGILNDMCSGSTIDMCVINRDGADLMQPYERVAVRGTRKREYKYPKGATEILSMVRRPIEIISEIVVATEDDSSMEIA